MASLNHIHFNWLLVDHSSEEVGESLMVVLGRFAHQLLGHKFVSELNELQRTCGLDIGILANSRALSWVSS